MTMTASEPREDNEYLDLENELDIEEALAKLNGRLAGL